VKSLAAAGHRRLPLTVARLLGRAAGRVALDDEDFRTLLGVEAAIGELARQAQLARCTLAPNLLFAPAPQAILGLVDAPLQKPGRLLRRIGQPMVEGVAHRILDDSRCLLR